MFGRDCRAAVRWEQHYHEREVELVGLLAQRQADIIHLEGVVARLKRELGWVTGAADDTVILARVDDLTVVMDAVAEPTRVLPLSRWGWHRLPGGAR